jgi:hypothetical protein
VLALIIHIYFSILFVNSGCGCGDDINKKLGTTKKEILEDMRVMLHAFRIQVGDMIQLAMKPYNITGTRKSKPRGEPMESTPSPSPRAAISRSPGPVKSSARSMPAPAS